MINPLIEVFSNFNYKEMNMKHHVPISGPIKLSDGDLCDSVDFKTTVNKSVLLDVGGCCWRTPRLHHTNHLVWWGSESRQALEVKLILWYEWIILLQQQSCPGTMTLVNWLALVRGSQLWSLFWVSFDAWVTATNEYFFTFNDIHSWSGWPGKCIMPLGFHFCLSYLQIFFIIAV